MKNRAVWIDTDLSVGIQRHRRAGCCDVDDGFAVLQLLKAASIDIKGISAVFGNTLIDNAHSLSLFMSKEFAEHKVPVFRGAESALELSQIDTNEAVEAMAMALRKDRMAIMAIGPATNVGLLLLKHPEIKEQIEEVILVAGRRKPTDYFKIGNQGNHAQDLNFDLDNDAFRIMFQSGLDITLCPFEISNKVWIDGKDLDHLSTGDKGSQWLSEHSRPWLQQWVDQGASGFNPFDVLASHYLIAPEDIISEPLYARLEIHPDDTVKNQDKAAFKQYLLCDHGVGYPVKYCYNIVSDFHERLLSSFGN